MDEIDGIGCVYPPMKSKLGATEEQISRLGVGGHTFSSRYGGTERAERGELLEIVRTAIEEGINLFDVTLDEEREVFGSLLKELRLRDSVFLSCWMSKQKTDRASDIQAEAERALALLGMDHVDLLYLDWTATEEQMKAMVGLRERGLTRFIGVLGTEVALATDLHAADIVLVNHNFYMMDKEPIIRHIAESYPHVALISVEPLGRGRFAVDDSPSGASLVVPCLKYALSFSPVHAVLVAVRRLTQLQENIRVWKSKWELSESEQQALAGGRGYNIACPE